MFAKRSKLLETIMLVSLNKSMAKLGSIFKSALNRSRKLQQFTIPVVKRRWLSPNWKEWTKLPNAFPKPATSIMLLQFRFYWKTNGLTIYFGHLPLFFANKVLHWKQGWQKMRSKPKEKNTLKSSKIFSVKSTTSTRSIISTRILKSSLLTSTSLSLITRGRPRLRPNSWLPRRRKQERSDWQRRPYMPKITENPH